MRLLDKNFFCVGIDLSSSYMKSNRETNSNALLTIGDIEQLPFKDNAFDHALCSETLEHMPDYHKALKELIRTSREYLFISIPIETYNPFVRLGLYLLGKKKMIPDDFVEEPEGGYASGGHIHEFNANSFKKEIERMGMTCIYEEYVDQLALLPTMFILSDKFKFLEKISDQIIKFIEVVNYSLVRLRIPIGLNYICVLKTKKVSDDL